MDFWIICEKMRKFFQNNEEYRQVDEDTLEAMSVLLDLPSIWRERGKYMQCDREFVKKLKLFCDFPLAVPK